MRTHVSTLIILFFFGLILINIGGCESIPAKRVQAQEPLVMPVVYDLPERPKTGSIYATNNSNPLFEDNRARNVGDIISIILSEQTDAKKSATTSTSKDTQTDITNPLLLGNQLAFGVTANALSGLKGQNLNLGTDLSSNKTFSGEGDSTQSNALSGRISAVITEIFPNGNMRIAGEKMISINQGDEYISVTGVIRPKDVSSDNSVLSTLIANAKISYGGHGVLAQTNEMGWLARMFNSSWWPF